MNAEELKATVERVRKAAKTSVTDVYGLYRLGKDANDYRQKYNADLAMLASAWLDEHPADSDSPIDKAWLEAIGATQLAMLFFIGDDVSPRIVLRRDVYGKIRLDKIEADHVPTRGDLLRLMAALGIPPSTGAKGE